MLSDTSGPVMRTHLIQTSLFSHRVSGAAGEEPGGEGEMEVEQKERWGQVAPFWIKENTFELRGVASWWEWIL